VVGSCCRSPCFDDIVHLVLVNRCSLRHSSRSQPLKLSTNVVPFDAAVSPPARDGVGGQLGAVVTDDHAGTPSDLDDAIARSRS
jgi:hypothetical protein